MQILVPFCRSFFLEADNVLIFLTSWCEGTANLHGEYFTGEYFNIYDLFLDWCICQIKY